MTGALVTCFFYCICVHFMAGRVILIEPVNATGTDLFFRAAFCAGMARELRLKITVIDADTASGSLMVI
jgi:hypothetical protein